MDLNLAAAENIRRLRKERKLSLERLATESGVSCSMLGKIERGEANPSVATLEKLASALKVPAEELLHREDFEPLLLCRELGKKPLRLNAGRVIVRPSLPYDDTSRLSGCFLELYITGQYAPEPDAPGTLCTATVFYGTVQVTADGGAYELQERDALRLPSDRPWEINNRSNGTAKLYLLRQYRRVTGKEGETYADSSGAPGGSE